MIFDIIILGVVLVSALHAFWRGFIREILTIFGAIGGVFATLAYGDDLRPLMDGWLGIAEGKDPEKLFGMVSMSIVSVGLSYLAIFVLVFGVLSFIAHLIAEQVRALGLGAVDRTLGVVFGLARGLLIVGIFYLPLHIMKVDESKKEWFQDSHTHFIVRAVSDGIAGAVPKDWMPMSKQTDQAKKESSEDPSPIRDAVVPKPDENGEKEPVPPQQGYNDKDRSMVDDLIEQGVKTGVDTIINPPSGAE